MPENLRWYAEVVIIFTLQRLQEFDPPADFRLIEFCNSRGIVFEKSRECVYRLRPGREGRCR